LNYYSEKNGGQTKSDQFLLDTVLANFSDEELRKFGSRLTLNEADLAEDPLHSRIILLDDWAISGRQLRWAAWRLKQRHPALANAIEAQLVVAPAASLQRGTFTSPQVGDTLSESDVPIRAYYLAHDANPAVKTMQWRTHDGQSFCGRLRL
jgi:hypothetical protein